MNKSNIFMRKIEGVEEIECKYDTSNLTLEGELPFRQMTKRCIKNKNNEVIRAKYPIFLVNLVNIPNTQLNFGGGI